MSKNMLSRKDVQEMGACYNWRMAIIKAEFFINPFPRKKTNSTTLDEYEIVSSETIKKTILKHRTKKILEVTFMRGRRE